MIAPDGMKYWIQSADGKAFPEHQVETKTEGNKVTMTCYLEIQSGVQYSICATTSLSGVDRGFNCYIDSSHVTGKMIRAHTAPGTRVDIHAKPIDIATSKPLQFAKLELTDDDDKCIRDTNYLMKLGEIEIKTTGGILGGSVPPVFSVHAGENEQIHEKSKKATLVGAKTAFGKGQPANNGGDYIRFFHDDRLPSHHMIFKYRTRQALILLKIIEDKASVEENAPPATSAAASSSSNVKVEKKRKSDANEKEKEVVDLSGEDIKPFKKKSRPSDVDKSKAGGSRATAIDLTNL